MPNGFYIIAASEDDCYASSSSYDSTGTYLRWGNISNTINRTYLRFVLDIPVGATILSAYLYFYQDAGSLGQPSNSKISLLDETNCAAFTSNPWDRNVTSNPSPVTWNSPVGTANSWRQSPDISSLVQGFISRSGYASGNYIGFRISCDDISSNNYFQAVQIDWEGGDFATFLVVEWVHYTEGKKCRAYKISASADDTWNASNDSNNNTAATYGRFGQIQQNNKNVSDQFSRVGLRWAIDIPKSATVYNAIIVFNAYEADTASASARIGALTDASAFSSNEYSTLGTFINSSYTLWSSIQTFDREGHIISTPNIANRVQDRVNSSDYNPNGSDPANYIAIGLSDDGDKSSSDAHRSIALYDHTTFIDPYLIVVFQIPKIYIETCVVKSKEKVITTENLIAQYSETCVVRAKEKVITINVCVCESSTLVKSKDKIISTEVEVYTSICVVKEKDKVVTFDVLVFVFTESCVIKSKDKIVTSNRVEAISVATVKSKDLVKTNSVVDGLENILVKSKDRVVAFEERAGAYYEDVLVVKDRGKVLTFTVSDCVKECIVKSKDKVVGINIAIFEDLPEVINKDKVLVLSSLSVFEDNIVHDCNKVISSASLYLIKDILVRSKERVDTSYFIILICQPWVKARFMVLSDNIVDLVNISEIGDKDKVLVINILNAFIESIDIDIPKIIRAVDSEDINVRINFDKINVNIKRKYGNLGIKIWRKE